MRIDDYLGHVSILTEIQTLAGYQFPGRELNLATNRPSAALVLSYELAVHTLTIRIPESKHDRLRSLAKARGMSINRLMDELATSALTQHDTEKRFRSLAGRGSRKRGLALLNKLDHVFAKPR